MYTSVAICEELPKSRQGDILYLLIREYNVMEFYPFSHINEFETLTFNPKYNEAFLDIQEVPQYILMLLGEHCLNKKAYKNAGLHLNECLKLLQKNNLSSDFYARAQFLLNKANQFFEISEEIKNIEAENNKLLGLITMAANLSPTLQKT